MTTLLRVTALLAVTALLFACAEERPAKLQLDPRGPLSFSRPGDKETIKVAAFDKKGMPFTREGAAPVVWTSSDESVAKVSPTGEVAAIGSGAAKITAAAWGLQSEADVAVRIVGSVEIAAPSGTTKQAPKRVRLRDKPFPMKVVVKDDKGAVIERPKVLYKALDYCVEVDDEGMLTPLTEGACGVRATSADKYAILWLDVKE